MPYTNYSYSYSTSDEIAYLNQLYADGKYSCLKKTLEQYQLRTWEGRGMNVDPDRVETHLRGLISVIDAMKVRGMIA